MSDAVHMKEDRKWYFWDEIWSSEHGPYDSEEKARDVLRRYMKALDKLTGAGDEGC